MYKLEGVSLVHFQQNWEKPVSSSTLTDEEQSSVGKHTVEIMTLIWFASDKDADQGAAGIEHDYLDTRHREILLPGTLMSSDLFTFIGVIMINPLNPTE